MNIDEAIDDLYTILEQHNGEYMDYASYEAAVDNLNIISNFVAGTRWIPVSERLPTPSMQAVLIFDGGEVYYAYFDNNQFIYRHLPGYGPSNVTHWMPLPEPPQEVE